MLTQYKMFIFSSDPDTLVKFYTEALGFNVVKKLEYELDYGYTIELSSGGMSIWLARHSKVEGKNKDPYRHILNLYTNSLTSDFSKVKAYKGVTVIAELFSMGNIIPGEKRYACTFFDPEDNCIQLMGQL